MAKATYVSVRKYQKLVDFLSERKKTQAFFVMFSFFFGLLIVFVNLFHVALPQDIFPVKNRQLLENILPTIRVGSTAINMPSFEFPQLLRSSR